MGELEPTMPHVVRAVPMSVLYYGDNLAVLREHVPSESVDLIYLDPPFNSNRDYNVIFAERDAADSEAQIRAFDDCWHWDRAAERTYAELTDADAERRGVSSKLVSLMESLRGFLGGNDMLAYLSMMAIRLVDLRRVLKPTGSLYLHCDPTASHYLKLVLDAIFGADNFLSEVIWKRTGAHSSAKRPGPVHDVLFFYGKSDAYTWNPIYTPHDPAYVESHYTQTDPDGRRWMPDNLTAAGTRQGSSGQVWRGFDVAAKGNHWKFTTENLERLDAEGRLYWPRKGGWPRYKRYLDEVKGMPLQDVWTDIPPVNAKAAERLGYPTQKPVALLERIIRASTNEGDVVLDPFCGCGTTIDAAQKLKREWIGIDVTHLAVALIRNRLDTTFPGLAYEVRGEPADVESARVLAEADPYQFQWWALHVIGARPTSGGAGREGKKGRDRGIDGVIRFKLHPDAPKSERVIVSVKAGHNLKPGMVRDLIGTMDAEHAPIGVLLTMYEPTVEMRVAAVKAGTWSPNGWDRKFSRVQLIAVDQAFAGTRVDYPGVDVTLKAAPAEGTLTLPGIDGPLRRGRRRK